LPTLLLLLLLVQPCTYVCRCGLIWPFQSSIRLEFRTSCNSGMVSVWARFFFGIGGILKTRNASWVLCFVLGMMLIHLEPGKASALRLGSCRYKRIVWMIAVLCRVPNFVNWKDFGGWSC
jgi:hypothetical protein